MTIKELETQLLQKGSSQPIVFVLAPYNQTYIKKVVDQFFSDWNIKGESALSVYWPGYGIDITGQKLKLSDGNPEKIEYSVRSFNQEIKQLQKCISYQYRDSFELVLFDVINGRIAYKNHIRISLDNMLSEKNTELKDLLGMIFELFAKDMAFNDVKTAIKKELNQKRLKKVDILDLLQKYNGILELLKKLI